MPRGKDWTNIKIHRLTFVNPTERRICQKIVWVALCECGQTTQVVPQNVKNGHIKSCGCFKNECLIKSNTARRLHTPLISSARSVWSAQYRDIDFEIFFKLSQEPCDYCGSLPYRTRNIANYRTCYNPSSEQIQDGNFTYNGLDRIDSSLGHTPENVVACCWECNSMKSNRTREEFLQHIEKIHAHSALRKM